VLIDNAIEPSLKAARQHLAHLRSVEGALAAQDHARNNPHVPAPNKPLVVAECDPQSSEQMFEYRRGTLELLGTNMCVEGDTGTTRLVACNPAKKLQQWMYNTEMWSPKRASRGSEVKVGLLIDGVDLAGFTHRLHSSLTETFDAVDNRLSLVDSEIMTSSVANKSEIDSRSPANKSVLVEVRMVATSLANAQSFKAELEHQVRDGEFDAELMRQAAKHGAELAVTGLSVSLHGQIEAGVKGSKEELSGCGLSAWGSFTSCTAKCGGGTKSRVRSIVRPPPHGKCTQPLSESRACNTQECVQTDCIVSQWGVFSPCTKLCGSGTMIRERRILIHPLNQGTSCPKLKETRSCATQACAGASSTPGLVTSSNEVVMLDNNKL
jgi:hypothetical protein